MSDLQIGLLLLGVLVIIGVVIYNRVQEARFRERAESAFAPPPGDALLEAGAERAQASERIEPQFQDDMQHEPAAVPHRQEPRAVREPEVVAARAEPERTARAAPSPAAAVQKAARAAEPAAEGGVTPAAEAEPVRAQGGARKVEEAGSPIAYTADLFGREPVPATALEQMVRAFGPLAARVQLLGRNQEGEDWQVLDAAALQPFRGVRAALQLVDRRGPVSQQDLVIFQSAIARCAASAGASANIPEAAPFLARSRELDAFCSEVDVVVGINLLAQAGRPFAGTRLRGLAEAAGFRLERGAFVFPDGQGGARFTLEQQTAIPITAESLRTLHATALTLLLDVPRQTDGLAAFDQMVTVGRQLSHSLGASLVDDNQIPVTESGLEQIRNQLRAIYATMQAHGIPAGSATALRLFS